MLAAGPRGSAASTGYLGAAVTVLHGRRDFAWDVNSSSSELGSSLLSKTNSKILTLTYGTD